MRVHVVHAHPVETSFNRALFEAAIDALKGAGHEVDPLSLYDEDFRAAMSREERLNYHDVPGNRTPEIAPYVERLRAADALVFIHPVWNYGYPAILKGYFDRIFLPGVSFVLVGGESSDKGTLVPNMKNIKRVAYVTTYGGDRLRTMLMGDPPRRLARRWAWVTFGTRLPPDYLALYDMNNATPARLNGFIEKVRRRLASF
jgi:NAD(P)H dehydrogenase (quinone)